MTLINHELMQAPAFPGLVASPHLAVMEEKPTDYDARENLLDEAFGPHRFEKTVERLRADHRPATHLALVAMDDDELVGTLRALADQRRRSAGSTFGAARGRQDSSIARTRPPAHE